MIVQLQSSSKFDMSRKGTFGRAADVSAIITGDAIVSCAGSMVFAHKRNALPERVVDAATPGLRLLSSYTTDRRGTYAGEKGKTVRSAIVGAIGPMGGYFPFPRFAAFNLDHPEHLPAIHRLAEAVAEAYKKLAPRTFARLVKQSATVHEDYRLGSSPFTTLTVNNTVAAAYHQDAGDLQGVLGVIVTLRGGYFEGFELLMPEYGTGVDMAHNSLILFDPHCWHANIPAKNAKGEENVDWWRLSLVFYVRTDLLGQPGQAEAVEVAKRRAKTDEVPDGN